MELNGANGFGTSVKEETDKRKRGTIGAIIQCGTSREAVFLFSFLKQYQRDIIEHVNNTP